MNTRRQTPLTTPIADPAACTLATRIAVCRKVPLFAGLDDEQLAQINGHCRAQGFVAGEHVYLEGEPATRLYVVATGAVKITGLAADGRESMIDLLVPGDFFGALPALGREHHGASATTLTPACLLGLDAREFDAILHEIPQVAVAALKGLGRWLERSQQAIHLLAGAPLEQRLAGTLLVLAGKVGKPWSGATLLDVPLAREELAAMAGAATESVSRLLSQWQRTGWLQTGRRWVAINDDKSLQKLRDGVDLS